MNDWETWGSIGKHGFREENERGERLVKFWLNNNFIYKIMNN